jgi:hypothetical protein
MEHPFQSEWMLWAHLPHDTVWTLASYTPIMKVGRVEELITLAHTLPEKLVTNCMLFFMRDPITPIWEDPKNRGGGCFSYKVVNKSVAETWRELMYLVAGETLTQDGGFNSCITGVSISPKKGFCILKIWMTNCAHQQPDKVRAASLKPTGCMFKRHA